MHTCTYMHTGSTVCDCAHFVCGYSIMIIVMLYYMICVTIDCRYHCACTHTCMYAENTLHPFTCT